MKRILPWLAVGIFLGLFFFYPMLCILWRAGDFGAPALHWQGFSRLAGSTLWFTFYQAALSTLLTLLVGLPGAYLFGRFEFRGRKLLKALTAVPFLLPTVVVAAGFNSLLGGRGWLNLTLMRTFDLADPPLTVMHTLTAILLAHVFYNTTILLRLVGTAWSRLDVRLGQAARTLGAHPWQAFLRADLPMLLPSILAAALLVFLFDFSSFGVILLLGGSRFATLEVQVYIQSLQMLNLPAAAWLSILQLACTLTFSILYTRLSARARAHAAPAPQPLRRARSLTSLLFVGGMILFYFTLFILPMFSLALRSFARLEPAMGQRTLVASSLTLDYYRELFVNRQDSLFYVPPIQALGNSLKVAGLTTLISLGLAYPLASVLTKPRRLERMLDPLLMLPLGASAVTLGLGYILTFNKAPLNLLTSPWLLPLAHSTIALPFVVRSLQPALASIPPEYRQAARVLGASPLQTWLQVDFAVVRRAILAAGVFAFTISLGEFGAASILYRPEFPTLPLAISRFLSQPGGLNYGQAMAMASILMTAASLSILLMEQVRLPGMDDL